MLIRTAAVAASVVSLALVGAPAHADPPMLNHAEWASIDEGMTRSHVEVAICGGCTGTVSAQSGGVKTVRYTTPVGHAYVLYGVQSNRTTIDRLWCPDATAPSCDAHVY